MHYENSGGVFLSILHMAWFLTGCERGSCHSEGVVVDVNSGLVCSLGGAVYAQTYRSKGGGVYIGR